MFKQTYALRLIIAKISVRERYLALITLFALLVAASHGVLILTGMDNHEAVLNRISQKQAESERVKQLLVDYQASLNNPKIVALQSNNDDLNERIFTLEERIARISQSLMSADEMILLLKELMNKEGKLTVVSFNVLPVEVIESNVDGGNLFYQHGLNLTLSGEFEALTDYLASIEDQPHQLFWDDLIIETQNFPQLEIQLNVHTLSRDKEWLDV